MKTNKIKKIKKIPTISQSKQNEFKVLSSLTKKQNYQDRQHLKEKRQLNLTDLLKILQTLAKNLKNKITLKTIKDYEDSERVERAKKQLKVFFLNSLKKGVFNFVVKSSGLTPENISYNVKIEFKDLLELKKQGVDYKKALKNSKLGLECSCDDYRYRFRYWLTKMEALPNGAIKELRYPKIRNANTEHKFVCKHIVLVTNALEKPSFRDGIFKRFYDNIDTTKQVRVTKKDKAKTEKASKVIKVK